MSVMMWDEPLFADVEAKQISTSIGHVLELFAEKCARLSIQELGNVVA